MARQFSVPAGIGTRAMEMMHERKWMFWRFGDMGRAAGRGPRGGMQSEWSGAGRIRCGFRHGKTRGANGKTFGAGRIVGSAERVTQADRPERVTQVDRPERFACAKCAERFACANFACAKCAEGFACANWGRPLT